MSDDEIRPSLEAVLHPERFEAFAGIAGPHAFHRRWNDNPDWVLANLAHAVYHPPATIERVLTGFGAWVRFYDRRGAQALLAHWPGAAVVAFRGTQVAERDERGLIPILHFLSSDVLADLRFHTVPFGAARVHRGFVGEFRKLWDNGLKADLDAHEEPAVWATGHSLGGALATLAGMHRPLSGVVTFGEPRVGRRIGAAFQAGGHLRFVNGRDLVTRLPPRLFRYRHHGERRALARPPHRTNALLDHAIVLYAQALAKGASR